MPQGLLTRPQTIDELDALMQEYFINTSPKVTKVAIHSVLAGISKAVAGIGQRAMKDVALVETRLTPSAGHGQYLDQIAEDYGVAGRFGAAGSSTYVRVVGDVGTVYTAGTNTFSGQGVTFDLEETVTIGDHGWAYAKIQSQTTGLISQLDAGKITKVTPVPTGHLKVVQEYQTIGARDEEDDVHLRLRIKKGINLAAQGTVSMITQTLMLINNDVLRVEYLGLNNTSGKYSLGLLAVNGADFTATELNDMTERLNEFLPINAMSLPQYNDPNVELVNMGQYPIDVSMRVNLNSGVDVDEVRRSMQIAFTKAYDLRTWKAGDKVEWDDLLELAKNTAGVAYVPDQNFVPSQDITDIPLNQVPRFRSFQLLDLEGNIISNVSGSIVPSYYPPNPQEDLLTFLSTID